MAIRTPSQLAVYAKRKAKTNARNSEIVALAWDGVAPERIAPRFGISRNRVYQILHRLAPGTIYTRWSKPRDQHAESR